MCPDVVTGANGVRRAGFKPMPMPMLESRKWILMTPGSREHHHHHHPSQGDDTRIEEQYA